MMHDKLHKFHVASVKNFEMHYQIDFQYNGIKGKRLEGKVLISDSDIVFSPPPHAEA